MTNQAISKNFAGRFENLAQIDEFVRLFAADHGFDPDTVYMIETAVDEACSNIIEHAYQGGGSGEIECCLSADEDCLTIVLKDHGISFDPTRIPIPNIKATLKNRKDHGLGIFMMRKIMDDVQYRQCGSEGNMLTMVKRKG